MIPNSENEMRLIGFVRRIFVMRVQKIMIRLDSKRALGRNNVINGVNVNIHQNASLILV